MTSLRRSADFRFRLTICGRSALLASGSNMHSVDVAHSGKKFSN